MEALVLAKNPHLKAIFNDSEFLFEAPETINEVSFETKEPVWKNILMAGDSAGMIAPLCGNGMAIAIHSAKILSELIIDHLNRENFIRGLLEADYRSTWQRLFSRRLWFGRIVQHRLFGSAWSSKLAVQIALNSRFIAKQIIKNTHCKPF
jgi:flavin-dependent dehydrogenase